MRVKRVIFGSQLLWSMWELIVFVFHKQLPVSVHLRKGLTYLKVWLTQSYSSKQAPVVNLAHTATSKVSMSAWKAFAKSMRSI